MIRVVCRLVQIHQIDDAEDDSHIRGFAGASSLTGFCYWRRQRLALF